MSAPPEARFEASPIGGNETRLSDRVAIELGTRIVRGELPAGGRLPTEPELCDVYRVSRSVIRDAIRILSGRGLVTIRRGSGMHVSQPSDAPFGEALIILLMRSDLTIAEVRQARAQIETQLAPLAAERVTTEDLERLRGCLEDYARAVAVRDWNAARDAHLRFHYTVLHAIRLPALDIILKPMQQIILLCSVPPQVEDAQLAQVWTDEDVALHVPIVEALQARDGEAVRRTMEDHFTSSLGAQEDTYQHFWAMPFRESRMAQSLLTQFLSLDAGEPDLHPA